MAFYEDVLLLKIHIPIDTLSLFSFTWKYFDIIHFPIHINYGLYVFIIIKDSHNNFPVSPPANI